MPPLNPSELCKVAVALGWLPRQLSSFRPMKICLILGARYHPLLAGRFDLCLGRVRITLVASFLPHPTSAARGHDFLSATDARITIDPSRSSSLRRTSSMADLDEYTSTAPPPSETFHGLSESLLPLHGPSMRDIDPRQLLGPFTPGRQLRRDLHQAGLYLPSYRSCLRSLTCHL